MSKVQLCKIVNWPLPGWNNVQNVTRAKISWGFQYTGGENPTFWVPCLLVSTQPSSYSEDGYVWVSVYLWLHLCTLEKYLALRKKSSFSVPFNYVGATFGNISLCVQLTCATHLKTKTYKAINVFVFQSQIKWCYKCKHHWALCFLWCHVAQALLKVRELCLFY